MNKTRLVIALDGPVAAGKGTLGKALAAHYGLAYLDTGALYRASALLIQDQGLVQPFELAGLKSCLNKALADYMNDSRLRNEQTGLLASSYAKDVTLRTALLDYQRDFAARSSCENHNTSVKGDSQHPSADPKHSTVCARGAILDGRDIGTVVLPQADAKLFITASDKVRAQRRLLQLQEKGQKVAQEQVLADLIARDAQDRNRKDAPLIPAEDAHIIDTSALDAQQALSQARAIIDQIIDKKANFG